MGKNVKMTALAVSVCLAGSLVFLPDGNASAAQMNGQLRELKTSQVSSYSSEYRTGGKAMFKMDSYADKLPKSVLKKLEAAGAKNSLYVVQLNGPVTEADRAAITDAGAEIMEYVPDFAFVVKAEKSAVKALKKKQEISSVTAYLPLYKLDPALVEEGFGKLLDVELKDTAKNKKKFAKRTLNEIIELASREDTLFVGKSNTFQFHNDVAAGIMKTTTASSTYGLSGAGQTVAVADTGLDTGRNDASMHEAFQGGKIKALYALGRTNNSSDPDGHGTHVAGSVLGDAQFKGMAPKASLVFQSIMDASGGLGGLPSNLNTLFSQAYSAGARIHTNSWGAPVNGAYTLESKQVDEYVYNNDDMTVLFAAGNEGPNAKTLSTPGTAKNAITVGASENNRPSFGTYADNINHIAAFSSRGLTSDGRVKPDIVAPGTFILSTRSSLAPDANFWATYNSKYAYMGGTSMATPLVAGNAALLREHFIKNKGITPKPSLIKASLIAGAQDTGLGYPNGNQGWGRVTMDKSAQVAFVNETKALRTSEKAAYSFNAVSGKPLRIALAWTDYPGNPSASVSLVNDLDLVIKSPSGKTYTGNDFTSPYNSEWDGRNNVETVILPTAEAGTYTIEVQAYNVPTGTQDFSFAVVQ
ncbi:S8 family serine peptidase [Metabacillus indicus]|uniref:S8 family serine peptidase n=1 Tax=Metabacillus indicus TaxID=246786 RepID=UPI0024928717|nr:S8 family serine peptidase [Metabacillus indicus]